MKTCPSCAETDLQDAALVCKHCGYGFQPPVPPDLVVADLKSTIAHKQQHRRTSRTLVIGLIVAGVIWFGGAWLISPAGEAVSAATFGPNWPLTIGGGTLRCAKDGPRKIALLETGDGIDYALNGAAKSAKFPPADSVLKSGLTPADLQPLIDRALALCR